MTDPVYEDTVQSYAYSRRLADDLVDEGLDALVAQIDTQGEGTPVVVFNSLGTPRTDLAEVNLGLTASGVGGVRVVDAKGNEVPSQIASGEKYDDGGYRRLKVSFLAQDVPAVGYAVYRAIPTAKAAAPAEEGGDTLDNEFFTVKVGRKTGAILSVYDKRLSAEVLSGPGNVVARQEDNGDLWEMYKTLDGGMYVASTDKQAVPSEQDSVLSDAFAGDESTVVRGPAYSEFSVSHPFADGSFSTRVRVCRGVLRIDVETVLVNQTPHVRYQVLFPTTVRDGSNVQEIPFGAVERPIGTEYPAQSWVDYGNAERGVALLNAGMPGDLVSDGTLLLSLMRSVDLVGYNEGRPSTSGYEIGVPRTFRYALVPHPGDWRESQTFRLAQEFNAPLLVRKAPVHAGTLPSRWGRVTVSHPNVVLSALKPGPGKSIVVRLYEAAGLEAKNVKIKFSAKVKSASAVDLLEGAARKADAAGSSVTLDFRPFEIVTLKVRGR
jgi:alpha-mannosidase